MTAVQEATGTSRLEDREATPGQSSATVVSAVDATPFAHASEAEMARILDFYAVRWEYEPTTFPILWNLDGSVIESFAPDFYLPDLEVFLEMTTLKQRLVRKKNRKLRRLRELYPDIKIKLFYARDFRAMMLKYGRLGLAASLSGTPGQVVPDRSRVQDAIRAAVVADDAPAAMAAALPADLDIPVDAALLISELPADESRAAPERSHVAAVPRAAPRTRSGRRRQAVVPIEAGADVEGGA